MSLSEETRKAIKEELDELQLLLEAIEVIEGNDVNEEAMKYAQWMKQKLKLLHGEITPDGFFKKREYPDFPLIHSGIYWAYLGVNIGSEENKHRPVLLLRSNRKMDQCTVIPLSSQRLNDEIWYHVDLSEYDNTALVEHMRVISKKRLDKPLRSKGKIATVKYEDMEKVYEQIQQHFATQPPRKNEKKRKN